MKTKKILFCLLAALLGGCVLSLHPLYTDKNLVFEAKLLGTWGENEDKWQFEKGSDPNSYNLTVTMDDEEGKFVAHLVKIDNMLFLDLFPEEPNLQANVFYKFHLLPAHTFMKVEQIGPLLKMRMMDPEKMEDMLKNDPNLIKHEVVSDRIVLTAATEKLQQFMRKHANDKDLFGDPSDLKRLQPQEPNDPNKTDPNTTDPEKPKEKQKESKSTE